MLLLRRGRRREGLTLDERIRSGDVTLAAHLATPGGATASARPRSSSATATRRPCRPSAPPTRSPSWPSASPPRWGGWRWPSPSGVRPVDRPVLDRRLARRRAGAVDYLDTKARPSGVWVVGFGTGGAVAICGGARDQRVRGVAAVGTPGDFDDWESHPRRLLEHCREVGLVTDPTYPPSLDAWARELRSIRGVACVRALAPGRCW